MKALLRTVNNQQLTINRLKRKLVVSCQLSVVSCLRRRPGISLVEMIVVIALVGILASAVMVALKPGKRTASARDAIRKKDIIEISKILDIYNFKYGSYPNETGGCDSSKGDSNDRCDEVYPGSSNGDYIGRWQDDDNGEFLTILQSKKLVKNLPIDPLNNKSYYYQYEPRVYSGTLCSGTESDCMYWVGARLEDVPDDKKGKVAFRCSDYRPDRLGKEGQGCKVVEYEYADDTGSQDNNFSEKPWCEKDQPSSC